MNLRTKLFLPLIIILCIFFSFAKWQWLPRFTDLVAKQNVENLQQHLHSVAESLIPLLLEEQLANVHATLDSLLESNPSWKQIRLIDKNNQLLYPVLEEPMVINSATELLMEYPIAIHTRNIGNLAVRLDISKNLKQISFLEQNFITALLILVFVVSASIILLVEFIVSRPVRKLAHASKLVATGNYCAALPRTNANDEMGKLVSSFESMRNSLSQYKSQVELEIEGHKHTAHELNKQKERFAYYAAHDSLTDLINRREFETRLSVAIDRAKTDNKEHTVMFIDLDKFKIVNDSCGHLAGDELLKQFSTLVQKRTRSGDSVARLGGDEFAVLLEFCPLNNARKFVEQLHSEIQDFKFIWDDQKFQVSASIGVAAITSDTVNVEDILSVADSACYTAKEQGRNQFHFIR